jgi:hypothetical protein
MIFCDDIWEIIKSYLLNKNDINRRLFIKYLNKESIERYNSHKNNLFKLKISNILYKMYLKDEFDKKIKLRLENRFIY